MDGGDEAVRVAADGGGQDRRETGPSRGFLKRILDSAPKHEPQNALQINKKMVCFIFIHLNNFLRYPYKIFIHPQLNQKEPYCAKVSIVCLCIMYYPHECRPL